VSLGQAATLVVTPLKEQLLVYSSEPADPQQHNFEQLLQVQSVDVQVE
jgi:hypothetical protein